MLSAPNRGEQRWPVTNFRSAGWRIALSSATIAAPVQAQTRLKTALACVGIGAATCLGVFVLPFFFPPAHIAQSGSYTAGFNNRIAVLAAGAACVLTFLWAWWFDTPREYLRGERHGKIPLPVLFACLAVCGGFTGYLGWMLTRSGVDYNDNLYFLEFMHAAIDFHLRIYRDFSFLYGPALLEYPVAVARFLRPFGVGMQGSYFVALALFEMGGVVLLWATVERLPLSRNSKIAALCILTAAVLCPLLGLNYSLIRALLPFSTLLFTSRIRRPLPMAVAFAFGEVVQLLFSPELGVAFAAGACVYACGMAVTMRRRTWLLAAISPVLGAGVFIAIAGRQYLDSMGAFSKGCLNLVVQPLPYMLLFLFSVVWLNPVMLGGMRQQRRGDALLMSSLFVTSLGMLPVALGRCDPLHVVFNGVGMLLLSGVALSGYTKNTRQCWWAMLLMVILWMQLINTAMFFSGLRQAARVAVEGTAVRATIDIEKLDSLVGHDRIAAPFPIPHSVEQQLIDAHHYAPDRECFHIRVWDAETEEAKAARMNQSRWALIPNFNMRLYEDSEESARVVGMGFHYPDRHKPYVYGNILYGDLAAHWKPVARFGKFFILYQQESRP